LVDLILSGRNVFYTGSAGCGKSTVLKDLSGRLKESGRRVNIIALLEEQHWTSRIYLLDLCWLDTVPHEEAAGKLKEAAHGKFIERRLSGTDVLVIDEISMVENHHFERLNASCRRQGARQNHSVESSL